MFQMGNSQQVYRASKIWANLKGDFFWKAQSIVLLAYSIVGRGVLTSLLYKDPPSPCPLFCLPPFSIFFQSIPQLKISFLRCDTWCGFLQVLWFNLTQTHMQTHTDKDTAHSGASRLTHPYKYIFTPPVICSQQLSLLH